MDQRHETDRCSGTDSAYAAVARAECWNLTDTSLETPASCMVTPYMAWAASMVRLEWVMTTNCVSVAISASRRVRRPMLASSRGASTSSSTQNGLGWYLKIAIS